MIHPTFRRLRLAPLLLACAGTAALADSQMLPGAWEFKMTVTALGPDSAETKKVAESTTRMCLTAAFLDKEPYLTPTIDQAKMERKGAKCSTSDFRRDGSRAAWKMACAMADGSQVDAQIDNSVSARALTIDIGQLVTRDSESATVKVSTSAAHIGECTSEMPVQ